MLIYNVSFFSPTLENWNCTAPETEQSRTFSNEDRSGIAFACRCNGQSLRSNKLWSTVKYCVLDQMVILITRDDFNLNH